MKLDRSSNPDGYGKYALINLRRLREILQSPRPAGRNSILDAMQLLETQGILEWGRVGTSHEFFVIKLKDINAEYALHAYSDAAHDNGDPEFAQEVLELALRSGTRHPLCKKPD